MQMSAEHRALTESISNATPDELFTLVYTDALTGVLNRRAFDADRRKHVAIFDLDSLKYLNDAYGHREGDRYLNNLACDMTLMFGSENVYRLGAAGDEFAVKSDDADSLVEGTWFLTRTNPTVSWGLGHTIERADRELLARKKEREACGDRAPRGERPPWLDGK